MEAKWQTWLRRSEEGTTLCERKNTERETERRNGREREREKKGADLGVK